MIVMAKSKVNSKNIGIVLIVLGIGIIIAGMPLVPLSVVSVGPVTVTDIPPYSAYLLGAGAIITIIGAGMVTRKRIF